MMEYDHQCKMDPTMPLKYPCTRYNIHLATLVIINLCTVIMSQSGDITGGPYIPPPPSPGGSNRPVPSSSNQIGGTSHYVTSSFQIPVGGQP